MGMVEIASFVPLRRKPRSQLRREKSRRELNQCIQLDYDLARCPDRSWDQDIFKMVGRDRLWLNQTTEFTPPWESDRGSYTIIHFIFWFPKTELRRANAAYRDLCEFHFSWQQAFVNLRQYGTSEGGGRDHHMHYLTLRRARRSIVLGIVEGKAVELVLGQVDGVGPES